MFSGINGAYCGTKRCDSYIAGFQLPLLQSYIICVIGNMLPVPVIYLFARRVLEWGADKKYIGKFFTFCIEKGHKVERSLKPRQVMDCL